MCLWARRELGQELCTISLLPCATASRQLPCCPPSARAVEGDGLQPGSAIPTPAELCPRIAGPWLSHGEGGALLGTEGHTQAGNKLFYSKRLQRLVTCCRNSFSAPGEGLDSTSRCILGAGALHAEEAAQAPAAGRAGRFLLEAASQMLFFSLWRTTKTRVKPQNQPRGPSKLSFQQGHPPGMVLLAQLVTASPASVDFGASSSTKRPH